MKGKSVPPSPVSFPKIDDVGIGVGPELGVRVGLTEGKAVGETEGNDVG